MLPALALLWVLAQPVPAASARAQGLSVDLRLSPGPAPLAALRFRMEPGWHLYWKNPGDSGLAPEVAWDLPPGWTAGPLEHPLPEPLPSEEGVDFAHTGAFTLLVRLHPPPGKPIAGPVVARLDWLACQASCVRGEAVLSATLGEARTAMGAAELAAAESRLPRRTHPGLELGAATLRTLQERWLIEVPLRGPAAALADAFFPEPLPGFTVAHRDIRVEGGLLRIPVLPSGPASSLDKLRGVLRLGGQGVALELTLPRAPAP
jgi:DsbC/DsbD-like thiol-disulfide interchange protein